MSYTTGEHFGGTDVVILPSFTASKPALILCGGNNDAISASPELFWESSVCDVVVDLD